MPYSLVPELDVSSRAYQKAISTLTKQAKHDQVGSKSRSKAGTSQGPAPMDLGTIGFFLSFNKFDS
jgi:hypothetical protein